MSPRSMFMTMAVLVTIWAVFGFLDVANITTLSFQTDGNNGVTHVAEDGPAAAGGLQVGDRIRSIGGIAVEDTRALSERSRPTVGETRVFVVDRGGQEVELDLQYGAQPTPERLSSYLAILVGLIFVYMGLWAFKTAPGPATRLLAIVGVVFGLAFTGGPFIESPLMASLVGAVITVGIVLGFAALAHFAKIFPDGAEPNTRVLYGPALIVGLILAIAGILQLDATSALNVVFRLVVGLLIAAYFGLALISIVKTWNAASAEDRSRHGLTLMVIGVVLGIGPLLITVLVGIVAPQVVIPGSQNFGLLLALIPITFAVAAVKSAGSGSGARPAAEAVEA